MLKVSFISCEMLLRTLNKKPDAKNPNCEKIYLLNIKN